MRTTTANTPQNTSTTPLHEASIPAPTRTLQEFKAHLYSCYLHPELNVRFTGAAMSAGETRKTQYCTVCTCGQLCCGKILSAYSRRSRSATPITGTQHSASAPWCNDFSRHPIGLRLCVYIYISGRRQKSSHLCSQRDPVYCTVYLLQASPNFVKPETKHFFARNTKKMNNNGLSVCKPTSDRRLQKPGTELLTVGEKNNSAYHDGGLRPDHPLVC